MALLVRILFLALVLSGQAWILSISFAAPSLAIIVSVGALGLPAPTTWNHSPPVPFGTTGQFLLQPFEVDARERSTACVKFSVSKFVAFLVFGHHSSSESHTANADLTVSTVESVPVSEFYWENEIVIQDSFFDSSNSAPTCGSDSGEESPVAHAPT